MLSELFSSLFFIAAAEMGDKTQLVALAFAARYRARDVLAGVFAATLAVHLFSVLIGQGLGSVVPEFYIKAAAGLSFIGFGIWTLRGDSLDDDHGKPDRFGPFLTVATAFFIAELGDKTMLATISLATRYESFVGVWVGSTIGMVAADGLAVLIGHKLGKKLPEKTIQYVSAAIFIVFGIALLAETLAAR